MVSAGILVFLHTGTIARRFGLTDIDRSDQVALVVKLTQTIDGIAAVRTLGGGGGVEAAGDEEHAESVVVVVAEAAGDAAGEFDEAVHGLGAAVG